MRRTTHLTTLFGRLSGIRTQIGQTKINDELTAQSYRLMGRVWAVLRLCESGVCLTTEETERKTPVIVAEVSVVTMKTVYTDQNTHNNKNTQI